MKVFISHSSLDKDIARRVAEQYRSRGVDVWIDEGELGPGDSWVDRLTTAISKTDIFALLLTANSLNSNWVRYELEAALAKLGEAQSAILPMLFEDVEIPAELHAVVWSDCRTQTGLSKCVIMSLRQAGVDYPLPAKGIQLRYTKRVPLGYGLRLVPDQDFRETGSLGAVQRKYVVVGDYAEQCGRSLRQILDNLWSGDSFDSNRNTTGRWTAIIFEVGEHNYHKLDVMPGTWKAVFRILSDKKRLGWIEMSEQEGAHLGYPPRDYYTDDQQFWYGAISGAKWPAIGDGPSHQGSPLTEYFGITNLCFQGRGITYPLSAESLTIASRIFLVRNILLKDLNYRTQSLGQTQDGVLLS